MFSYQYDVIHLLTSNDRVSLMTDIPAWAALHLYGNFVTSVKSVGAELTLTE